MSKILSVNVARAELTPWQPPHLEIVEGEPEGRCYLLHDETDADGKGFQIGVFECEPAQTIYRLVSNETLYVLEGELNIALDSGDSLDLGPGDVALLPKGSVSTWTFKTRYKELFILSD